MLDMGLFRHVCGRKTPLEGKNAGLPCSFLTFLAVLFHFEAGRSCHVGQVISFDPYQISPNFLSSTHVLSKPSQSFPSSTASLIAYILFVSTPIISFPS